jgi:hypothetical protein
VEVVLGDDATAEDLELLVPLRKVVKLALNGWIFPRDGITDAEISAVARMPGLRVLSLTFTAITDASIPRLEKLNHLETLDLNYTFVTEAGAKRLRRALPSTSVICQFHRVRQ